MFTSFQRLSVIRQGEKGGGTRVAPLLAGRVGIPPALPHGAATFPLVSTEMNFKKKILRLIYKAHAFKRGIKFFSDHQYIF